MGDKMAVKKIIVNVQENGIIRDDTGLLIGRLTNEISFNDLHDNNKVKH